MLTIRKYLGLAINQLIFRANSLGVSRFSERFSTISFNLRKSYSVLNYRYH